jgi:hypothetical protein
VAVAVAVAVGVGVAVVLGMGVGGACCSGTNLRRDRVWDRSGSGTMRKGGQVLAGTREGARKSVCRRRANGSNK